MTNSATRHLLRIGASISVALLAAGTSQAAYMVTGATIDSTVGGLSGTIVYTPKSFSENANIGRLRLTGYDTVTKVAFNWTSYCVDIFDVLKTGTFTAAPVSTLNLTSTKLNQLNALLSNVEPYVTNATTSAAAQMAVWEIVNESGSYDVTKGFFDVNNISSDASLDANQMLYAVTSGYWKASNNFSMALLTGANNQTQIIYGSEANNIGNVPEPATWAMMIGGFGMVGAAMRRRKVAVSFG